MSSERQSPAGDFEEALKRALIPLVSELPQCPDGRGRGILAACSGGPDSMALVHALAHIAPRMGLFVAVGTVDHGLRPGSAEDADFVLQACDKLSLPCAAARLNGDEVRRLASRTGGGLEEAARKMRYAALRKMARGMNCGAIATAHTLEDQAETLLMRLAAGCGLKGARGILKQSGCVIRPMLEIGRAEVAAYLAAGDIHFCIDPTNESGCFTRNRVRRLVLPALTEALGPHAPAALARFCAIAAEAEDFLSQAAEAAALSESFSPKEGKSLAFDGLFDDPSGGGSGLQGRGDLEDMAEVSLEFRTEDLLQLHPALRFRILARALEKAGGRLDFDAFQRLNGALSRLSPQRIQLPGGRVASVRYGRLSLGRPRKEEQQSVRERENQKTPASAEILEFPLPLLGDMAVGSTWRSEWRGTLVCVTRLGPFEEISPGAVGLTLETLQRLSAQSGRLILRTRRCGDIFRPRGAGGTKKLQDFFTDAKIPREQRAAIPLLVWESVSPGAANAPQAGVPRPLVLAIPGRRDGEETARSMGERGGIEMCLVPGGSPQNMP